MLRTIRVMRLLFAAWLGAMLLLLAGYGQAHAEAGDTLRLVRSRGVLRCGVSDGVPGFSTRDAAGNWSGMDVDFCRAVAAAVLGSPAKVRFVALRATARFPALNSREIDILARNTTWTVAREATFSVIFVGTLYFDSQGLIVRSDGPFAHGEPLHDARVCVEEGSNELGNLKEYAAAKGWTFTPVAAPEFGTSYKMFLGGKCSVLIDDLTALADLRQNLKNPAAYVIRADRVAKEPLGPAVRWGDGQWLAIMRAVYAVLIDADERGLTQDEARRFAAKAADPAQRAWLDDTARIARAFGLAPDWAVHAIASVGNYGEMFARNLGTGSRLKLPRGLNRPWTEGGILYAPPFQ